MKITFIKWEKIHTLMLPEKISGQFWLTDTDGEGELISIEGFEKQWVLKSNAKTFVIDSNNNQIDKIVLKENEFYTIVISKTDEKALIFTEPVTRDRQIFNKFQLPKQGRISIGKLEDNHICFNIPFISRHHAEIELAQNKMIVRDLKSANGTFVNDFRITEHPIAAGDSISIMGLTIIVGWGFLAVNNPDGRVAINLNVLKKYQLPDLEIENEKKAGLKEIESSIVTFYRAPRFKRSIQNSLYRLDPPPNPVKIEKVPMVLMLGPSITMGMTSVTMGLIAVQNVAMNGSSLMSAAPTLMMSMAMLLGTILWPTLTKRHEKKQCLENEDNRQRKYLKYLNLINEKFSNEIDYQREILIENFPGPQERAGIIMNLKPNLWERTIDQDDFLEIRLGQGTLPLNMNLEYPQEQFSMEEDDLKTKMYALVNRPKYLEDVPVTISLKNEKNCGFIGNTYDRMRYFDNILVQLAALHSYDELKLVFLYSEDLENHLETLKWLPHVWSFDKSVRFIARNSKEIKEVAAYLEKEITVRQELTDDALKDLSVHYVIFAMDKEIAAQADFLQRILHSKKHLGFTILSFYHDFHSLPKECSKVIEIREGASKKYDREDTSGIYQGFKPDLQTLDHDAIWKRLSNISLGSNNKSYHFPYMLSFLEMYGVGKVEHLNSLSRWLENDPTVNLEAIVGVNERGEDFKVDFHEKYHGPHGLIAGMTGSGKSEFIITFILSMAINYHPNEVSFILIDYKGGGMASTFENLPHLVGTITNLDGGEVKRSLISIQSEINRRQEIFKDTGARLNMSNIDIYEYQRLFREGLAGEPLQHLFIITDEFAELKMQQPDFMEQLVSAARIGRSLGIHLILATQKPSGVVDDQIWSNSRLKICLKVQEKADSLDMIKRGDAAELKNTGRFFMQVGFNEFFDYGQSAWSGAPYYPEEVITKEIDDGIVVVDRVGQVIKEVKLDRRKNFFNKPKKQTDVIVSYLSDLAQAEKVSIRQLWLPPLKELITLEELSNKYAPEEKGSYYFEPIIGEYDDPANQRQALLRLEISRYGNSIIYGSPGSGKLDFLQTMLYSLISQHSGDELNLYLLDFGSETLAAFREAPQVGDVLFSFETEAIHNLFKNLGDEIIHRKRLFSNYGGNFETYVKKSEKKIPAIMIVIENYTSFIENYDDLEDSFSQLTREGSKYGVYFVVTAASANSIRYKIFQNFKQNYVLQLNDNNEYSGILGNVNGIYPSSYQGRGIFKSDNTYEFQTASIIENKEDLYDYLRGFCQQIKDNNQGSSARRVPVLPEFLDLHYFEAEIDQLSLTRIPLGIKKSNLENAYINFEKNVIFPITGANLENNSFDQCLLSMIKPLTEVILMEGKHSLENNETIISDLFKEMVYRNNTYKDALAIAADIPAFEKKVVILKELGELLKNISEDSAEKLQLVLEKAEIDYQIFFIIIDEIGSLAKYSFEKWFKKNLSGKDGVWLGDGFSDQYILTVDKINRDMYDEISDDFGYLLENGKAVKVKIVQNYEERW